MKGTDERDEAPDRREGVGGAKEEMQAVCDALAALREHRERVAEECEEWARRWGEAEHARGRLRNKSEALRARVARLEAALEDLLEQGGFAHQNDNLLRRVALSGGEQDALAAATLNARAALAGAEPEDSDD